MAPRTRSRSSGGKRWSGGLPATPSLLQLGRHEVGIERLRGLYPDDVDGEVTGDRQEPGRDAAATWIVGSGVPPGPHERLLGHILGGGLVAHDRQHQAVDPRLEAPYECRRGVRVAGRQTGQKGLIRES